MTLTGWRTLVLTAALTALAPVFLATAAISADQTPITTGAQTTGALTTGALPAEAPPPGFTSALDQQLFIPDTAPETEKAEHNALAAFYQTRQGQPIWIEATGLSAKAAAIAAEIANAGDYGLDAADFALPVLKPAADGGPTIAPDTRAEAEANLSLSILKYARFARGGRIMDPAESLNSNLDRKPQLLDPKAVLDGIAASDAPDAYLRSLHPKHPQFEKLRLAYVAELQRGGSGAKSKTSPALSALAKRLRANMEEWRWMPENMGDLHVFNNIPEFMQYVYKNGEIIRTEKIVAGLVDKPSSIFTRPLKHVVLRPMWRVPESIKVNELWPSLLRGGGLMREFGLQMQTKDGKPVDWHQIDWSKADIRNYEVIQPPGGKSVLGAVKFSFPSQHTIYMHDTPDRWMFRQTQRTLSHGCLRVKNPVELAEIILQEDKGWDKAKIADLMRSGPLNNEVAMEKRIPIHLTYFTAWVDATGRLKTFADVYGHEKRITLALDGKWSEINKGRNHLAPVELNFDPASARVSSPSVSNVRIRPARPQTAGEYIGSALGIGF